MFIYKYKAESLVVKIAEITTRSEKIPVIASKVPKVHKAIANMSKRLFNGIFLLNKEKVASPISSNSTPSPMKNPIADAAM